MIPLPAPDFGASEAPGSVHYHQASRVLALAPPLPGALNDLVATWEDEAEVEDKSAMSFAEMSSPTRSVLLAKPVLAVKPTLLALVRLGADQVRVLCCKKPAVALPKPRGRATQSVAAMATAGAPAAATTAASSGVAAVQSPQAEPTGCVTPPTTGLADSSPKPAPNRKPTLLRMERPTIVRKPAAATVHADDDDEPAWEVPARQRGGGGPRSKPIFSANFGAGPDAIRDRLDSEGAKMARLRTESDGNSVAAASARFRLKAMKARVTARQEIDEAKVIMHTISTA